MTRAIILAAGKGDRLHPLTDDKPKCLVPLFGASLLARQIATLRRCGVEQVHIATGYRSDQIEALGYEVTRNQRYAETNMVESLFAARSFLETCEEDLIIGYGDIVYEARNLDMMLASDADISLMIDRQWQAYWQARMDDPLRDAETLLLDDSGYVAELGKRPSSYDQIQGQYTGLIKIRAERIRAIIDFYLSLDRAASYEGKDFDNMYMTSFLQLLIDDGWRVKAVEVNGGWLEVDTVDDLDIYQALAESGELDRFYKISDA